MIVLGQYGVERWNAADDQYLIPQTLQISTVERELPGLLDSRPCRRQDRGQGPRDCRYTRSLPDPQAAFTKLAEPLGELAARHGLVVEQGKNVWEIRAPGTDKGAALRSIVDETGARLVIFAGDDLGDLAAFRAVRAGSGGCDGSARVLGVEEEEALAELSDVIVDGPAGFATWLQGADG